jgi:hypothetical protein
VLSIRLQIFVALYVLEVEPKAVNPPSPRDQHQVEIVAAHEHARVFAGLGGQVMRRNAVAERVRFAAL